MEASRNELSNDEIKRRVRRITAEFVRSVDPVPLSDYLIQEEIISICKWQSFNSEATENSKCRALLHHLLATKHPKAFKVVLMGLKEEKHYLANKIENPIDSAVGCEEEEEEREDEEEEELEEEEEEEKKHEKEKEDMPAKNMKPIEQKKIATKTIQRLIRERKLEKRKHIEEKEDLLRENKKLRDEKNEIEAECRKIFQRFILLEKGRAIQNPENMTGFIHDVCGRRRAKNGWEFMSFQFQVGPNSYKRCLSYCPANHEVILMEYEKNRQAVSIEKFGYRAPSKGYYGLPTMVIYAGSIMQPVSSKHLGFSYKVANKKFISLDEILVLPRGEFVNIRVKVISEGDCEFKSVGKDDPQMKVQTKVVMDEKGNQAQLTAWGEFVDILAINSGWFRLKYVTVQVRENKKILSTSCNTVDITEA